VAVFILHIFINSSSKTFYFWSHSVIVLWTLWLLGVDTYIKYASLMLLSSITMSGLLLWIFRSVIMDLSRYSL